MEKTLRQRIMQIKAICEKEALRVPTIADIVSESGEYVSERTIYKLLEDDSENGSFQNHSVIAVYEALISRFGDTDVQDVETLKRLLMERDKQIDRILMQVERCEEEMESREKIYADRKKAFENTISILKEQNSYLIMQIERKDEELKSRHDTIQHLINLMMKD